MTTSRGRSVRSLIACAVLLPLPVNLYAWEPNTEDLVAAVKTGDFTAYFDNLSTWLNRRAPADSKKVTGAGMKALLEDRVFANTLAQRQLISKVGADNMAAFARGDQQNKGFLAWLLRNTEAMELYLEGATPVGTAQRQEDRWTIDASSLNIWNKIYRADPESKEGIYLKLAIATGLNPPGTGNRGAGQAKTPADPVDRYEHFKSAHKNKELFPSFDTLSVWEYRQIVSSNASDADLAWAREMINTWRPDLRINEQVVNSTSEVWRRFSPFPYDDTFKNVLAGGGKCGPRSSWSVFICQAFGIPAVGVSQPGHACAAYKAAYPHVEPQPGNAWKVVYGRGWHVSKTCGLSGPEFMEGMEARSHAAQFSQIERLRWLASTLDSKERAAAVMEVAAKIAASTPAPGPAGQEARAAQPAAGDVPPDAKTEPHWKPVPGVIHVEAESFAKAAGVFVHDCFTGGKQVFSPKYGPGWGTPPRIDYVVEVPETGIYGLTIRAAAANFEQSIEVAVGTDQPISVQVPNTHGLWGTTPEVDVRLQKGTQTLTLTRPASQRGVALRYLELKSKK